MGSEYGHGIFFKFPMQPLAALVGGLVVSVLAFRSDDPSSNPADAYNIFCK